MENEYNITISKEQARLFARAISVDDIKEYIENHQAEYEQFLLDEKAGEQKHDQTEL